MKEFKHGFIAELSAGSMYAIVEIIPQINQILELVLLSGGVVSMFVGLFKFIKAKKK